MIFNAEQFNDRLIRRLSRESRTYLLRRVDSAFLRRHLISEFRVDPTGGQVVLGWDYYWVVYVEEGRGPVTPVTAKVLCFFPDPRNDPRTDFDQNRPKRPEDVKRLTKEQFYGFLNENKRRRKRGQPPIMVTTQFIGPSPGKKFISPGMDGFSDHQGIMIIESMFEKELNRVLRAFSGTKKAKAIVRFG